MPSDSLNQTDIDRILGGRGSSAPRVQPTDVQVYDFRRPNRISREKRRSLEAMYDRLVRSLEAWLINRVRDRIELRLTSVDELSFGEYLLFLPTPSSSFLVGIQGSEQQGVIDFGRELGYFLVDRLFGGSGSPTIPDRTLTPIERMVLRSVTERVLTQVSEVWQDQVPLDFSILGFETIPEIMQGLAREDPVLVVNVTASFGEHRSLLSICLPLAVLEKFFAGGGERLRVAPQDPEAAQTNETALRVTRVAVSARLPEFRLSLQDVAALQVGSVLSTGIPTDAPIKIFVGSQPRFISSAGRVNRKRAVRITDQLTTDGTDA